MKINLFVRYPKLMIIVLTFVMTLIFFDRGVVSAILPNHLQTHWGKLSNVQSGAIMSAFVIGFMISCPIFGAIASKFRVGSVMAFGVFTWSLASLICALLGYTTRGRKDIWAYYAFVTSRTLIGIGEAAFIPLCMSAVDDISPEKLRSSFQSAVQGAMPVGIALGYTAGGFMVSIAPWSAIFLLQFVIGVCLSIILYMSPIEEARMISLRSRVGQPPNQAKKARLNWRSALTLFKNPVYILHVLAQAQYTAVVGAVSFWSPTWLFNRLKSSTMSEEKKLVLANVGFSAVILVGSIFGTILGGIILDFVQRRSARKEDVITTQGCFISTVFVCLAVPMGYAIFPWRNISVIAVFIVLGLAITFLFALTSPSMLALITCVDPELRDIAIGSELLLIHILGDFPSPTVFGWIADWTNSLDLAMTILWTCLIGSALFYSLATLLSYHNYRKRASFVEDHLHETHEALDSEDTSSTILMPDTT